MQSIEANAATYFVTRNATSDARDKTAFIEATEDQRSITYGALGLDVARMGGLFERFDIRPEERIALLALDEIAFPVIFWGGINAGVVPVALNTLLSTDVYSTILQDCRARALFVSAALYSTVEPLLAEHPYVRHVFVIGGEAPVGAHDFAEALAASQPGETYAVSPDDCAFWLYSSGSTGQPKGVRHVHSSLRATCDTYASQVLGIQADDVVFSVAKLFFAYGLGNGMSFPMSVGASTILFPGRPTPESVTQVLADHKPTVFCGVPTLYAALNAHLENLDALPNAPIRRCISAGEALPEDVGKRWHALWGVDILDGVGSTELLHIFLSNRSGEVVYGTSGVAVPGYELRLVDDDGAAVATGEVGELLVKGASASDGYWNQRARSRLTFEGEWTHTGDKYTQDESGRYTYCGRTDDMFKVSGIWLSPFEVEQALSSHPLVLEAAVIARADSEGLDKPMAFVVLQDGAGASTDLGDTLKDHVKAKVGMWKYPRWIEIVEELPKTATGKIQRFKLRAH